MHVLPDRDEEDPCISRCESLLKELREKDVTRKIGKWLTGVEVSLAIASITQAITAIEMPTGGLSTINQLPVESSFSDDTFLAVEPIIRFGRPLLVPVTYYNHTVLLIIQFEERRGLTISILDSKAVHYDKYQRDQIFKAAQRLIRNWDWGRHSTDAAQEVELPPHAQWIPGAH